MEVTSPVVAAEIAGESEMMMMTGSTKKMKIAKELRIVLRSGCHGS